MKGHSKLLHMNKRGVLMLGAGFAVLVILVGIALVWWQKPKGESGTSAAKDGTKSLCRNWDKETFAKAENTTVGELDSSIVGSAYQANACALEVGEISTLYATLGRLEEEQPQLTLDYFNLVGARGLLAGWSTVTQRTETPGGDDPKEFQKHFQKSIGKALSVATDPDSSTEGSSKAFVSDLIDASDAEVEIRLYNIPPVVVTSGVRTDDWQLQSNGPTVYGWSILAPLLRFGDFHEDFLVQVATPLVMFDQKQGGDWTVKGEKTASFDMFAPNADDGMGAVLEALSRNKEAAKKVAKETGDERVKELL